MLILKMFVVIFGLKYGLRIIILETFHEQFKNFTEIIYFHRQFLNFLDNVVHEITMSSTGGQLSLMLQDPIK
jgi:hypothetical protein